MHLVFWQPIPSFHQEGFLNALADATWVESVSLVYEADIYDELKESGWRSPRLVGVSMRALVPGEIPTNTKGHIHFFTGFYTHASIWSVFAQLPKKRQCRVFAFAEAPAMFGWRALPRLLKYRLNGLRLRNRLDGVLALGGRGQRFYQMCLGAKVPVYNFAYYDRPLSAIAAQASVPTTSEVVELLYVGRLIHLKGLDRLFIALSKISRDAPAWRLTLVGDGAERDVLETLANKLSIADRLRWTGALDSSAVNAYYKAADYLIQPSRGDGWGMTIVEALRCGCEVIASTACGAADLAKPEWRLSQHTSTWPVVFTEALKCGPLTTAQRSRNIQRATVVSAEAGEAYLKKILSRDVSEL